MSLIVLTGCKLSSTDVENFIRDEQSAMTYSEYSSMMDKYKNIISPSIINDFSQRLVNKSINATRDKVLLFINVDEISKKGVAFYSIKDNWEYKLIKVEYDDNCIVSYSVQTLYGNK